MSVEFSRQEYWSGLLFPSPGDLPKLGIKAKSPALAGRFFTAERPGKPSPLHMCVCMYMLSHLSYVWPFATLDQAPSVHGILQARILEWIAMPSSRGSFQFRDWTGISWVSSNGKQVLYPQCHQGSSGLSIGLHKTWQLVSSDQVSDRRWGKSASFYPDLETSHCFCWSISRYFVWNSDRSEILLLS